MRNEIETKRNKSKQNWPKRNETKRIIQNEIKPILTKQFLGEIPQGFEVIFSHHQVCIKKKKGGHFLGAKSESRVSAPFFASKMV